MARIITDIVRPHRPTSVTTFFNGDCPVCSARVARYRHQGRRRADLLWRDLADCPDALRCFGIDRETARKRLHVVDRNGILRGGIDAFAAIWRELPGAQWLAVLVGLPGIHTLAAVLYDKIMVPALWAWNQRREAARARAPLDARHDAV